MKKGTVANGRVNDVMLAIRQFTRSSLLLQHSIASKIGLNATDAECIDFLMEMGPSTAGDLAKATGLTTGAITAMIDRLERAGMVAREKDPNDRRKVIVKHIMRKNNPAATYYGAMANDVLSYLSGLKDQDLKHLLDHTQTLIAIFERHTRKVQES